MALVILLWSYSYVYNFRNFLIFMFPFNKTCYFFIQIVIHLHSFIALDSRLSLEPSSSGLGCNKNANEVFAKNKKRKYVIVFDIN